MSAPHWPDLLAHWSIEPAVVAALIAAALAYARGRRVVPDPGSARRPALFGLGLAAIALALLSPIATYADALFAVHMVQHLLLVLVAAPLLVASHALSTLLAGAGLGAPRKGVRRGLRGPNAVIGAGLGAPRKGVRRGLRGPNAVTAWLVFAVAGWVIHLSPLFDAALRHAPLHAFEHVLFLGSGVAFWCPVLSSRLSHPARLLYLAVAMPQNTFLALVIYSSAHPLYDAYVQLHRQWGPSPLADQRTGAGIMWVVGDLTLLVAVLAVAATWPASEEGSEEPEAALNP